MKAITVRQPCAWLIVAGKKDIENTTWKTHYWGKLLIHAASKFDAMRLSEVEPGIVSSFRRSTRCAAEGLSAAAIWLTTSPSWPEISRLARAEAASVAPAQAALL